MRPVKHLIEADVQIDDRHRSFADTCAIPPLRHFAEGVLAGPRHRPQEIDRDQSNINALAKSR